MIFNLSTVVKGKVVEVRVACTYTILRGQIGSKNKVTVLISFILHTRYWHWQITVVPFKLGIATLVKQYLSRVYLKDGRS